MFTLQSSLSSAETINWKGAVCLRSSSLCELKTSPKICRNALQSSYEDVICLVNMQTLMQLNCLSGSFIHIRSPNNITGVTVLVYVVDDSAESLLEDNTIQLSSSLFFNLINRLGETFIDTSFIKEITLSIHPIYLDDVQSSICLCGRNNKDLIGDEKCDFTISPMKAISVYLIKISAPFSPPQDIIDACISNYFSFPRILQAGLIISIPYYVSHLSTALYDNQQDKSLIFQHRERKSTISSPQFNTFNREIQDVNFIYFVIDEIQCEKMNLLKQTLCSVTCPLSTTLIQKGGYINSIIASHVFPNHVQTMILEEDLECNEEKVVNLAQKQIESYIKPLLSLNLYKKVIHSQNILSILISGEGVSGREKVETVVLASQSLHMHYVEKSFYELLGPTDNATCENISTLIEYTYSLTPSILHITDLPPTCEQMMENAFIAIAHSFEKNIQNKKISTHTSINDNLTNELLVLIGSTSAHAADLPKCIRSLFGYEIISSPPDIKERESIIKKLLQGCSLSNDIDINNLAQRTAGRSQDAMAGIISSAMSAMIQRSLSDDDEIEEEVNDDDKDNIIKGDKFDEKKNLICWSDFEVALSQHKSLPKGNKGSGVQSAEIPKVLWDDIGGLAEIKNDILDMVHFPIKFPELFASGIQRRSGILLFGPPGTGKTLLAKAVATECKMNFISVKGPELLNMYVGESEKNVRQLFQSARSAKPSILFFDELDSLAPVRGAGGESGGVMDRVVSQLLTELDGMESSDGIYVIGATNRPDLLDPALMRPGRLDKLHFVSIPKDIDGKVQVMKALTRKFTLSKDVDFAKIVSMTSQTLTGADLYSLCSQAYTSALKRRVSEIEEIVQTYADVYCTDYPQMTPQEVVNNNPELLKVIVLASDFIEAAEKLVPSVTQDDLKGYEELKNRFT